MGKKGYSLVEILVVIAIVGTLISIVYSHMTSKDICNTGVERVYN